MTRENKKEFLQAYGLFLFLQEDIGEDAGTAYQFVGFRKKEINLGPYAPEKIGQYNRLTSKSIILPSIMEIDENKKGTQDTIWLHGINPNKISEQSKLSNRLDLALYMIKTMAPECVRLGSEAF